METLMYLEWIGEEEAANKLTYVYETIKLLKQQLPEDKSLIGFTGAPWTLATYMIEGQGTKTYNLCKKIMYSNPEFLHKILRKVTDVVKFYLEKQIEAGADVVQIFDSWAAAIEPGRYDEFSWKYMVEIAEYIKERYPHIPVIMFPKGVAAFIERGLVYGNFDVFGVDWGTPMALAKEKLGSKYVLQGNMEPLDIVGVDAAILFSDILVIPNEMGMHLEFLQGEGPVFKDPIKTEADLDKLIGGVEAANKLTYVYETIKLLKQQLPEDKALIGFTGAPWTLATYMIEGQGTKTYNLCKKIMYSNPEFLHKILRKVTDVVKFYLEKQIDAGADVVQIFDSWAAAIEPGRYDEFSWKYMVEIAEYIKERYPHIPVIMFPSHDM